MGSSLHRFLRRQLRYAAALCTTATILGAAPTAPAGYRIESIAMPEGVLPEIEALDFAPDGTAYISTRRGDVWRLSEKHGQREWQRFAHGLQEPLGLLYSATSKSVFVTQKSEITELIDENQDGVADFYRQVGSGWGYSGNYSEYTHGLVRDAAGNLYFTLNLSVAGAGSVKGSAMTHNTSYRGWLAKITPEGKFEPIASGLRSPAGIAMSKDEEIYVTENQGDWVPTGALYRMQPGRFYGHPASLADWPEFQARKLDDVSTDEFARMRTKPNVYIPYGELANSPGQPSFNYTKGKFGAVFENQIFVGDQTRSNVFRIVLDRVGGDDQGAVIGFAQGFPSGPIRGGFAPDGSYWVGEIDHGWPSGGPEPGGLHRIVWDGKTIPFEIRAVALTATGFRIDFTQAVDRAEASKVSSYELAHWHFLYQPRYYSPKLDETELSPTEVSVAADGMSAELVLPLVAERLYRIRVKVPAKGGSGLMNNTAWYTLNRLVTAPPR